MKFSLLLAMPGGPLVLLIVGILGLGTLAVIYSRGKGLYSDNAGPKKSEKDA